MRNHSTSEVILCFLWISTSNTNHTFNQWTSLSCSYTVRSLGRRVLIKKTFHHFTLFISLYVSSELWDDKRAFNSRSQPTKEQLYIEYKTAYEIHEICVSHWRRRYTYCSWKFRLGMSPANDWCSLSPSLYACHQLASSVLITWRMSPFMKEMPSSLQGMYMSSSGS